MLIDRRKILGLNTLMASKHLFLKCTPFPTTASLITSRTYSRLMFSAFPPKPTINFSPYCLKSTGFSYTPHAAIPNSVELENPELETHDLGSLIILNEKLRKLGIGNGHCKPGQYGHLACPMCNGGKSGEKTLSLLITKNGAAAWWNCFRAKCGWKGNTRAFADLKPGNERMNKKITKGTIRKITEQELELQPLCREVHAYFAERMISRETLRRNFVMQKTHGDEIVIAFPYRRNGELVSCKYRDITKRFWQERNTEKIFYGLDDINGASDIIIVEGEIDKLSMEEAGFYNCVSVPDGAPQSVSEKELPSDNEVSGVYPRLLTSNTVLQLDVFILLANFGRHQ